MPSSDHLLIPIKVQALVIDQAVIDRSDALLSKDKIYVADDGKWSPVLQDYRRLTNSLETPGPKPFYGASRKYKGSDAAQLVLPPNSAALPQDQDRGVYLHWVMPSGLRHVYKPDSLDFPALPDQWLIVRFCRRGTNLQAKAWFLDSGLVGAKDAPKEEPRNLLIAESGQYEARPVGKAVALDQYKPADFQEKHTTITAVGNAETGSPSFTASTAENRNVLSWHDDLSDLRNEAGDKKIPREAALSYLVLGWYRDDENEPLQAIKKQIDDKDVKVLEALGWKLDTASPPADIQNRRCMFHGMVAHINYWNPDTHKGPLLGYPGSPSVEGVLSDAPPSFKVGVGNNAEDALVALVSSEYSGAKDAPNLWKALEAVMYRQPESLVGSWNAAPRDNAVHQSWFNSIEAGRVWTIRPRSNRQGLFPTDAAKAAEQASAEPTGDQLLELKALNDAQSAADAASRELAALQQDLYSRWWSLCQVARDPSVELDKYNEACRLLTERVADLRSDRNKDLAALRNLPEALRKTLSPELELRSDSAPRFWSPADPVIVIKNCGLPSKHQTPRPLMCRLPEETVTVAEVEVGVNRDKRTFGAQEAVTSVSHIAAALKANFAARAQTLTRLLEEGSVLELAVNDLVQRTLPAEKRFFNAGTWRTWTQRITKDLTADPAVRPLPLDNILLKAGSSQIPPQRVVELWGQQPWSPLFLDWQITWRPTQKSGQDFGPIWQMGAHDFGPVDRKSLPETGVTVRGRSLLSPIDGRIFDEPIRTLRALLDPKPEEEKENTKSTIPPAVRNVLNRYKEVWDVKLAGLATAGMMGQALNGLHQALLRRDITLPRVMPDPARPWGADPDIKFRDEDAKPLLDPPPKGEPACEWLSPPAPASGGLPFTLLRSGALEIEELWLMDDFGQWADLLKGTSSGGSAGQVLNPRARWHDDRFAMAMPPRVVQPARLNFRFKETDETPDKPKDKPNSDPALSPICGWICFNPLDQSLVLCDRTGQLAGEILITPEGNKFRVNWERKAGGSPDDIRNPSLRGFAKSLVQSAGTPNPRAVELLSLIEGALQVIRPASARRDGALFGRPLALVSASLGLELFGKAWSDPDPEKKPSASRPSGAGDPALDNLRLRVNLGCAQNREDGLIGYFKADAYDRIVPAYLPKDIQTSGYIGHPENDAVRVGFGTPEQLTLLMDPWGSVQAAVGIVPAKTITLAQPDLDKILDQMEASFRVGPVLIQPDRLALPAPTIENGQWSFSGPVTANAPAPVGPVDVRHFSDQPVIAAEGRLLLLNPRK